MSCGYINRTGQVMGVSEAPAIALRGPGCISGTGLCDGVLGTGGISCSDLLGIIGSRCGNVMGTGGCGCGSNVLGTGGTRCGNNTNNVSGAGGRRNCKCSGNNLKTPTIVPR